MDFGDWLTGKFEDWSEQTGGDRSDFARWLKVPPTTLSNWLNTGATPRGSNLNRLVRKLGDEVYVALGMPAPSGENNHVDVLPEELRRPLKKAFDEVRAAYRAENIDLNSPEAVRIAKEIFERNGFKYSTTVDVESED